MEDNKLIAEFLGWPKAQELEGGYEAQFEPCDQRLPSEMPFQESWDWLMPAIEKLEEEQPMYFQWFQRLKYLRVVIETERGSQDRVFEKQIYGDKLKAHYEMVVEVIKFINK